MNAEANPVTGITGEQDARVARATREARLIGKMYKATGMHISAVGLTTMETRSVHMRELINRHALADADLPPDIKGDGSMQRFVDRTTGKPMTFRGAFLAAYGFPLDGHAPTPPPVEQADLF